MNNFSVPGFRDTETFISSKYVEVAGDTMTGNLVFSGAQKIIGGTSTTADLTLQTTSGVGATGADMHFLVGNNGNVEAATILNNGNVGIGTATPENQLSVNIPTTADSTANVMLAVSATDKKALVVQGKLNQTAAIFDVQSNNKASIFTVYGHTSGSRYATANAFKQNENGLSFAWDSINDIDVNSTGIFRWSSGSDATTGWDTGLSRLATNKIGIGNGTVGNYSGTLIAGSVGIGTNNPAYLLDVNGTTQITGVLTLGANPSDGTSAIAREYVESRGENLITNGSGLMGDDYNFTTFTYSQTEVHGGAGSFLINIAKGIMYSDELIPIDSAKYFRLVGWAKSGETGGTNYNAANRQYFGIAECDIDGLAVVPQYVSKVAGSTDTTLAAQLNPGDATVTLTDATGWQNGATAYERAFVWYGYTNAKGYTYPNYTYTRYHAGAYKSDWATNGVWAAGGITGNVITLRSAWTGPVIAAGTAVRNSSNGVTFKYIGLSNGIVPNTWTRYEGYIGTVETNGVLNLTQFHPGTAYLKLLFLVNYHNAADNNVRWSDLWFSELSSRNLEAATATAPGVVSITDQTFSGKKTFNEAIIVNTGAAATIGQVIKAAAAQTANLTEWQSGSGAILDKILANGSLYIGELIYTENSGTQYGCSVTTKFNPSGACSATNSGMAVTSATYSGNTQTFTTLYGLIFNAEHYGTNTLALAYGVQGKVNNRSSGTITSVRGSYLIIQNIGTGTITNGYGLFVDTPINSGGGAFTNAYGIYVGSQAVGSTLNYAIYTNSGDVRFGDDVLIASPNATALTIGNGTAGIDYQIKVDGETNDGYITWMEDEDRFDIADATRIGDGTNYANFAGDGELTLAGTARVKNSYWIDAGAIKAPGVKPASQVDWGIGIAWEFSDGTDDTIVFNIKIANRMDRTVAPTISIGWSSGATEKVGVWQLEYLWTKLGEDTTAAAQETLETTSTTPAQADGLVVSTFTGIDVPDSDDVCLHCRLKRLGADGDDTLSDTAELHGTCIEFTSNKLGTAT